MRYATCPLKKDLAAKQAEFDSGKRGSFGPTLCGPITAEPTASRFTVLPSFLPGGDSMADPDGLHPKAITFAGSDFRGPVGRKQIICRLTRNV